MLVDAAAERMPKPVKVAEAPRMLTTASEPAGASMDSSVAPVKALAFTSKTFTWRIRAAAA